MAGADTMMDLNEDLDILGTLITQDLYTQICLAFAVAEKSSYPAIVDILTSGLERVSASFPWVAGRVVNEGPREGSSGTYKIRFYEKIPRLVVKDLRRDSTALTMDTLRQAKFPFSKLDESVVAPRNTLPGGSDDSSPVFLLQATFINGGLLLTFVGQHNVMDMTGQGQIIDLISKACCKEAFTSEELESGNLARSTIVPFLDDSYQPGPELDRHISKALPSEPASDDANDTPEQVPRPNCMWVYWNFPSASLIVLKSLAAERLSSGFVSTDDVLSAFVWQSIVRARLPRFTPISKSSFGRAVDVRRYMNISPMYAGLLQSMTFNTLPLGELAKEPLGNIASQLRSALDPKAIAYSVRALATILSRISDKSMLSITGTLDLSVDLMLSSWSKLDCYDLDFGLGLGKPESVRRPQFTPVESLIYLMPKMLNGDIAVGMCLREEDLKHLKEDKLFAEYAQYIG